jgi:hypothetical protein
VIAISLLINVPIGTQLETPLEVNAGLYDHLQAVLFP